MNRPGKIGDSFVGGEGQTLWGVTGADTLSNYLLIFTGPGNLSISRIQTNEWAMVS